MAIADNKLKYIQFSSEFNYERFKETLTQAYSVGSFGQTTYTIPHNLGYRPFFRIFIVFPSGRLYLGVNGPATYEASSGAQCDNIKVDNTNFYVTMSENDGGGTISGTIYINVYEERLD